jgi:uncharacterized phiE125 gp8 family phage protein
MPGIKIETPSAELAVSLDMAKLHLNVTVTDWDPLITEYIQAATVVVEGFLGRSLINKGYVQSLDYFPRHFRPAWSHHHVNLRRMHPYEIKLLNPPLISVETVEYYDTDSALQTLSSPADFQVDTNAEPGRIMPKVGSYWPATLHTIPNAVRIHFTAGYGDNTDSIPANFKTAIKQIVGLYYQFREPVTNLQGVNLAEIPQLENLLWNDRVMDFSPTEG